MFQGIDFSSDTVTKPTPGMRQAIANAEVGDEQKGEDPTTRKLEETVAALLGQTAAIFLPSATLANQIALRVLSDPGDELLAAENCHLFVAEAGGPAIHSSLMSKPIPTSNGIFNAQAIRESFTWPRGPHHPVSKILSVENTTNMGGGVAWPDAALQEVLTTAKTLGLKTHLDGSRLFNASVATKTTVRKLATGFDTATLCLSKGLGCPAGAVLAFDQSRFQQVRRWKQAMGGSLRQSGMLAAAGLYALTHHIDRLNEDHAKAQELARLLGDKIPNLKVENTVPSTNMVFFRWSGAKVSCAQFLESGMQNGVRFSQVGENRFRAVTHLDIKPEDIGRAAKTIKDLCMGL